MAIAIGQAFIENSGTTSGGSVTQTGSITTTASGSSFIAIVRAYASPTGVTDSKGNTYTLVSAQQNTTDTDWLAVYQTTNGTGGATHRITATFGTGVNPVILGLIEVTGAATSSLIDVSGGAFDSGSPFGQSVTTTNANDMVIGLFGSNGAAGTVTYTAGGSFTLLSAATFTTGTDGLSTGVATRIVSATGSYDPAFTVSSGGRGPVISLALKQAGAAAATLSAPTPSGTLGTQTTATIGATTNQNTGTFYCVVDSAANLSGVTAAQIKAGQKASGAAALAAANSIVTTTSPSAPVTGLTANTLYSYSIIQNNGNGDSNIVSGTFTTAVATFAVSIPLVDGTGAAYASSSFNWVAYSDFGITKTGNGTTSTNGSGVLAVSGVTASGSGWVIGKLASNPLIIFATAVTFA